MFYPQDIQGDRPDNKGLLALTFDDGPGPNTEQLARLLNDRQIRATFFILGSEAEKYPGVLPTLVKLGHLIGNHTYSHANLIERNNGEAAEEILKTHQYISAVLPEGPFFFRAPWGYWPEASRGLPDSLNGNPVLNRYCGPISWDVSGIDCGCWQRNESADECAGRYIADIRSRLAHGGIIDLHDNHPKECEMVERLLSQVQGYKCVRLDEMPSIRNLIVQIDSQSNSANAN
jgi:peptidoglycan/xylan/chitin deacetylase (PgdA/CDA1 family)